MKELPRIARIDAAMSKRLERMIRREFDSLSPYDLESEAELLDMAAEFGLWELRAQMLKDSLVPNEKR